MEMGEARVLEEFTQDQYKTGVSRDSRACLGAGIS